MKQKHSYLLLQKVFQRFAKREKLKDVQLVCSQHILQPQQEMFLLFIEYGVLPENIFILGKAYSTNKKVLIHLREMGVSVWQPAFSHGNDFDAQHKNNCEMLLAKVPRNINTIVLDDGAFLLDAFFSSGNRMLFGVEQTSAGFRKLEKKDAMPAPVINVARSCIKLQEESPKIAIHAYERIREKYTENHAKKVFIVGLGPIGMEMQSIFKKKGFSVEGFDVRKKPYNLLEEVLQKKPDITIGATGVNVLTAEEVECITTKIQKNIAFISISSSDREFPVSSFRTKEEVHEDVLYKNIIFVNNGFPITFKGNENEIHPSDIEKTMCLLAGSILCGLQNNFISSGIVKVPDVLEEFIQNKTRS
jgi:S-adenosylhomocysteine hydrolase